MLVSLTMMIVTATATTAPSHPASEGVTLLRLDADTTGVTPWVIHEFPSGFTIEALASSAGLVEAEIGWSIHPSPELTLTGFAGVLLEKEVHISALPIILAFQRSPDWVADVWAIGTIPLADPHESTIYLRSWVVPTGIAPVGPWFETTIPTNGEDATSSLGVVGYERWGKLEVQLFVGAQVRGKDFAAATPTARLSAVLEL